MCENIKKITGNKLNANVVHHFFLQEIWTIGEQTFAKTSNISMEEAE